MRHVSNSEIKSFRLKLNRKRWCVILALIISAIYFYTLAFYFELNDISIPLKLIIFSPLVITTILQLQIYFIKCPKCDRAFISASHLGNYFSSKCDNCKLSLNNSSQDTDV